jgi:hypothetical protein
VRIGEATNQKDLIDALEQARDRRLNLRRPFEALWWNNLALVAGDHYSRWDPTMGRFEDRDLTWSLDWDHKKPRLVINHALTVARTELAKLTKNKPVMEIIANSDEAQDIAATKVGKSALEYAEWKFKLMRLRKQALWWMIQTGLGATYIGWDHTNDKSGFVEFMIDPATGEATFSKARQDELKDMLDHGELESLDMERYPLGEVDYKVFSPFQLLPDELASDFDQIGDLITDEIVDVDVLKQMYPSKADEIQVDESLQLGTMQQRMIARAGIGGGISQDSNRVENGCRVSTYWLPAGNYYSKFLEKGYWCRWTSNKVVLDTAETFPYQDNRIPFAFFQHIPSASIWPDAVITHIRGPNLEIDKTVSQLIENKDYMANPMWIVATQHKIKGEVKNIAGSIVRYRHVPNVPPPAPVQGMAMPQQVENLLAGLREQILEISGQSEVSRGNVPSGARSGVAVAYMQEEDDTKIAPTVDNLEQAVAMMGSLTLERFSQFYTFQRILRFYRRDGIFDVLKFKGSDLKNNTDVVTQAGSAMPRSKAAKQQYTLELVSMGVIQDPHQIEQMLELGSGEPNDVDKSIAQANRENNMMLHGVWGAQTNPEGQVGEGAEGFQKLSAAVPVKAWHNHQVHIQRHTSIMMDEEFDDLSVSRPEVVRLFDEHIAMHQQMLQQQQQQQAAQLMAAKGAPDGPPTPPSGASPGQNGATTPPGGTDTFRSTSAVPDVIAGGQVKTVARQIRPQ